jgi:uncharacterized protein YdeI (YjbR/CyaY-like superfamily)
MDVRYFATPAELRAWLEQHHATADELWVGAHNKSTGRPSVTWEQIVDEALCFGWIDGIRKGTGEASWAIRLTPRRKGSVWSARNIENVARLREAGLMTPAGEAAYDRRDDGRSRIYSYEQREAGLDEAMEARFRESPEAWDWWAGQPAGYRKQSAWYVMSAKRPETRERRLQQLIEDSAAGRRLAGLTPPARRAPG